MVHTLQAVLVGATTVGTVLAIGGSAQIFETVVCLVAIAMIYLLRGPALGHIKPRQSVFGVMLAVNLKVAVALPMKVPGALTNSDLWARRAPMKFTCHRIVRENAQQFFMADHIRLLPGPNYQCKD